MFQSIFTPWNGSFHVLPRNRCLTCLLISLMTPPMQPRLFPAGSVFLLELLLLSICLQQASCFFRASKTSLSSAGSCPAPQPSERMRVTEQALKYCTAVLITPGFKGCTWSFKKIKRSNSGSVFYRISFWNCFCGCLSSDLQHTKILCYAEHYVQSAWKRTQKNSFKQQDAKTHSYYIVLSKTINTSIFQ